MSTLDLARPGSYDGNTESSQRAPLNTADSIAQGAAAVSANGGNPWGVPQKDVRELLGRIHGHLAGRSGELQTALREAITKTAGATMGDPMGQLGGLAQNLGFPRSRPTSPAPPGSQGATATGPASAAAAAAAAAARGPSAQSTGNPLMEMLQKEALAIVGIVMEAVQQWYKDGKLNLKCVPNSSSPPPPPLRKSSVLTKAMLPQTSKVADPTTTLSVPRPFFASPVSSEEGFSSSLGPHVSSSLSSGPMTTTTFVSPGSITEITWLVMPPTPLAPPINPVRPITHYDADPMFAYMTPSDISPCHSRRGASSPLPRLSISEPRSSSPTGLLDVRCPPLSESSTCAQSSVQPARSRYTSLLNCAAASNSRRMTSFPALMMRNSTNDWLIPPADVNQTRQKAPPNRSQDRTDRVPRCTRIVSIAPSSSSRSRRASASPQAKPKGLPPGVGSAIGISSGKRRSSRSPTGDFSAPSVLQQLRKGSLQIGQALSSALTGDTTGSGTQRRDSSAVRMRAILDRFPPLPQPDSAGIFEAMTGAQRSWQHSPP